MNNVIIVDTREKGNKKILEYSKDGNHISKVPNNEQLMFKINKIIDYLKNKGYE